MSSAGGGDGDSNEAAFAGTLVERSRFLLVVWVALFSILPLAFLTSGKLMMTLGTIGFMAVTVALLPLVGWHSYYWARRTPIRIRETPDGLVVESEQGTRLLARGSFRRGTSFEALGGQHTVDLRRLGRGVRIEVARPELARVVLAGAGVDRRAGTSRFLVRRIGMRAGLAAGLAVGLVFSATLFLGLPGIVVSFLWLGMAALGAYAFLSSRTTLTVGADGVELKPLLGRPRFIPHAEIELVRLLVPPSGELVSHGFEITSTKGTGSANGYDVIRLDTRAERFRGGIWSTDPVCDAVARAWGAARRRDSAKTVTHQLASAEASAKDWIARLRALGAGDQRGSYRAAAIDERALFDVVTDANAEADLRAAAAVALGANPEHAPRLRVMADDIADDRVRRVALAALEPEDDARLEEELEPLRRMRAR